MAKFNTNALFIGWNRPIPGRENRAGELFNVMTSMLDRKKSSNEIDDYELCMLSSHGGTVNGFALVQAPTAKLDELRHSDEFLKFVLQASNTLQGWSVIPAYRNEEVHNLMQEWMQLNR